MKHIVEMSITDRWYDRLLEQRRWLSENVESMNWNEDVSMTPYGLLWIRFKFVRSEDATAFKIKF